MYSIATFVSILVFCMPAAFYAGHASAVSSAACDFRQSHGSFPAGRSLSSGGVGRQLSHDSKAERRSSVSDSGMSCYPPAYQGETGNV